MKVSFEAVSTLVGIARGFGLDEPLARGLPSRETLHRQCAEYAADPELLECAAPAALALAMRLTGRRDFDLVADLVAQAQLGASSLLSFRESLVDANRTTALNHLSRADTAIREGEPAVAAQWYMRAAVVFLALFLVADAVKRAS